MSSKVNITNFNRNSNINLLDQTKSILNFFQKDSSDDNTKNDMHSKEENINYLTNKNENNLNNNLKIKKESNINNYLTNIPKKNEENQKFTKKKGEKFLDIFLNFDYSKYPNQKKDKEKNYFKQKDNNNYISYEIEISENKENKNINFKDYNYQKTNNIGKNDFIKNSPINQIENISKPYINNNKIYSFNNQINSKMKNINEKNKSYIEEEIDYQTQNNTYKHNNSINRLEIFNNYKKYLSNNIHHKKYQKEQNYTSINNTSKRNFININSIERTYLDSLENSEENSIKPSSNFIKKSKNKYHYNIKLTRNLQDQIISGKNNSYKTDNDIKNNTTINFNYKEKEKNSNTLYKTFFDKGNNDNNDSKNRSCIISRNDLIPLDNNKSNENQKLNKIYCSKNSPNRCPNCSCINNNLKVLKYNYNKNNFQDYNDNYKNDNFNCHNKKINDKHSSLPKNIFKKENTLQLDYNSNSFYLKNGYKNNTSKINKLDKYKINNNKIKYLYKDQKKESIAKKYNLFYKLILDFIKQDNSIENIKQILSSKEDVNLIGLFRLFDRSSNHLISSKDFFKTLNEFGLYIINEDIKYLFRKFNKKLNELIEYEEFCDIILPKKYSSAKIMSERNYSEKNYRLSEETKEIICLLFKNIIEGEKSNENNRKIIERNGDCSGFDLFNKIKKSYSIGIYKEDISNFMKKYKYKISNAEIELIMERFDKNRDGMIDYKEFLNEISPIQ